MSALAAELGGRGDLDGSRLNVQHITDGKNYAQDELPWWQTGAGLSDF